MNESIGPLSLSPREDPYLASAGRAGGGMASHIEALAARVDREIHGIVAEGYQQALDLLRTHREPLDRLANALLEEETLDEEEILAVAGMARGVGRG